MSTEKLTPEEVRIIDIALAELNSGLGIEAEIVWEEAGIASLDKKKPDENLD